MAETAREMEYIEPMQPIPHNRQGEKPTIAYPEDFRLEALRKVLEEGKSITLAAREMGIQKDTLAFWLRDVEETEQIEAKALNLRLARLFGEKILQLTHALTSDKLAKASPRDIAIALGILADKRRDIIGVAKQNGDISLEIAWKDGGGAVRVKTKT